MTGKLNHNMPKTFYNPQEFLADKNFTMQDVLSVTLTLTHYLNTPNIINWAEYSNSDNEEFKKNNIPVHFTRNRTTNEYEIWLGDIPREKDISNYWIKTVTLPKGLNIEYCSFHSFSNILELSQLTN